MRTFLLLLLVSPLAPSENPLQFRHNAATSQWDLSNGLIRAQFQLGPDAKFGLEEITDLRTGKGWKPAPGKGSSPVRVHFGESVYDGDTPFRLLDQRSEAAAAGGQRQIIVLEDLRATARVQIELEMFPGQTVLRHRVSVRNLRSATVFATRADMLPYSFALAGAPEDLFRVEQWSVFGENFSTRETHVGQRSTVFKAGSAADDCGWFAARAPEQDGLLAGWEFDGRTRVEVGPKAGAFQMSAEIETLHHPVEPGQVFEVPAAFLGVFQGDWDDAGFRTQQFSEAVLAKPQPEKFPYISWDSWGHLTELHESTLRDTAKEAAGLGFELFIVDLGWARHIGDWQEDPAKFPSGLRGLSDYVHRQGMKFGLHFALAEVAPEAPVLREHPDWTASVGNGYFGAQSLCLSNRPTREWLVREGLRMIDEYGVDYILQDGENMVKQCNRTDHTHDPEDSNYSNAVEGINWVIAEIQRQRPNVLWENCENGGHMMTFNMVRHYVTSITNDANGALGSRQGVWGATYPFSPRYADRYMPENPASTYITRSYMFGGPWHFMNRLAEMTAEQTLLARREIEVYKKIRAVIANGKVFHLVGAPGNDQIDALEAYSDRLDSAVALVTRNGGSEDSVVLRLRGLYADRTYTVRFQDDSRVLSLSGRQLAVDGVRVNLGEKQSAEIVYADRP